MKKITMLLILVSLAAQAQVTITPFAGINSTRVMYGYWEKGGNYGLGGIEVEARLKAKRFSLVHVSFLTGAGYLANGYFTDAGFSTPLGYLAETSELKTNYLQVPLEIKLNWQPFPLVETWKLFFGAGVSNDILLKSRLKESGTEVNSFVDPLSPPQTMTYFSEKAITEYGRKYSPFARFEIGTKYKRVHIAYRTCFSIQDMHHAGLEESWPVPERLSSYMSPLRINGKRNERYTEFVLGWRISSF
jgi:hypothetical protein